MNVAQTREAEDGGLQIIGDVEIPFGAFSVILSGVNAIVEGAEDALDMRGGNFSFFTITEPLLERM